MAAPKKTRKISVKATEDSTEDLAKKIETTAEKIADKVVEDDSASGAPEIDLTLPNEEPVLEHAAPEHNIQVQTPQEQDGGPSSAPELTADSEEPSDLSIDSELTGSEHPERPIELQKSVGELVDESDSDDPESEFADAETSAAVDDIVASESDEILEAEDRAKDEASSTEPQKGPKKQSFFKRFTSSPSVRWGLLTGFLVFLAACALIPNSRYVMLNAAGVRSSSSVTVLDSMTNLPLKNVSVSMQGQQAITDNDGKVAFQKLKLGKTQLKIEKRGFATLDKSVVLGWGSNPLAPQSIEAVGSIFAFSIKDFVSGSPITTAEASSGEASAKADEKGEIRLVVDQYEGDLTVNIVAPGLRTESLVFGAQDKTQRNVEMVPDKPSIFVSTRRGEFDIYQIDIDGKNEKPLLLATGKERDDLHLVAHTTQNIAALVSTREGNRNKDKYVLSGLFIIEPGQSEPRRVAESERIRIIDWHDKHLIYVQTFEGASAANPDRSRLKSYNYETGETKELATANYFNDVVLFNGEVYYAPSSYAVNIDSVKFFKIKPDNTGKQTVLDKEVWNISRIAYDTLAFSSQQSWYELKTGGSASPLNSPPTSQRSRSFRDNQAKTASLWVDERDGKGVLIRYGVNDKEEKVLITASGLSQPVRWLNDSTAIYRVATNQETADYVVSVGGGEPKKIVDVTNTGTAEDYYY